MTSSPAANAFGEAADVDRHRVGAERPDGHALLHVRAAQLAEAHVERHLAALVARTHAAAGAGVVALVALAGRLALAGALAAAEALGGLGRARVGAQVVESQFFSPCHDFFAAGRTSTRNATWLTMPRITGVSSCTTV